MIRNVAIVLFLAVLTGCKVAVIAVEGGRVLYGDSNVSGEWCPAGSVCLQEVTDTGVSPLYYAEPEAGWEFVRWNVGEDFLCQGIRHLVCELPLPLFAGIAGVEALVASDKTYYVMPVFQRIPPTVTVGEHEWYQPTFFAELSWHDIHAVCPAGACDGSLNGHDVTGWTWASVDDVNALFNGYIGHAALGPGASGHIERDSAWAPAFVAAGWRWFGGLPLEPYSISGWTRSDSPWTTDNGAIGWLVDRQAGEQDRAHTNLNSAKDTRSIFEGAWFYRPVQ